MEWQKEEEPLSFSFVALELKFNFVINHDMRTFSFLFFFSIFRMDLYNQRSHMGGHMITMGK